MGKCRRGWLWVSVWDLCRSGRSSSSRGVARGIPRHDTGSSHLSAGQFREKDVRLTSLSNSRCVLKMSSGPVPSFLTESSVPHWYLSLPGASAIGTPQNKLLTLLPAPANHSRDTGFRPLSPRPVQENEGLQLGTTNNLVHRVVDLREVRVLVCSPHIIWHSLLIPFARHVSMPCKKSGQPLG